jgi:CspA family cold shock protein
MRTGIVKFYNEEKRFGFIKADTGEDIFVHASGLKQAVKENDKVTFETETGKKGMNAVNVQLSRD